MLGYNEMLSRIKPSKIICYGNSFDEMKGDVIEVDYGETNNLSKEFFVKKIYGYVMPAHIIKGGGSANGQSSGNPKPEWQPKNKDSKRFLGKPGEIKETFNKNGERRSTKIGKDGKAIKERHFSDHKRPDKHTVPHDHNIDWSKGVPNPSGPINYPDGNIPEFKSIKGVTMYTKNEHILEYPNYTSIQDFKDSLIYGKEIVILWKNIYFTIEYDEKTFSISEAYKPETERQFNNIDDLLDHNICGEKLSEIITKVEVDWRNI